MKKKKKSIHLRRIRQRSTNKFRRRSLLEFHVFFKYYFSKKKKKNFSFCSFLLCFKGINIQKALRFFKIFGLNKYYVLKNDKISFDYFLFLFKKKYNYLRKNSFLRRYNVMKKKNLFLHVSYRHYLRLPVRGQRTKTNAKTRKHYAII